MLFKVGSKSYEIRDERSLSAIITMLEKLSENISGATNPPTDKQIWLVERVSSEHGLEKPENYNSDGRACWLFLNKHKDKLKQH